jgi:anti-sigma factor RsiW
VTCEETRISLGVYLVGALDPAERAAVDEHLRDCRRCRAELADLAMLPSMLDQLSPDDLGEVLPVPVTSEALFARVAAQARAEADAEPQESDGAVDRELARHRLRRTLLAAAAAVTLVGGATATTLTVLGSTSHVHSAAQGPVHMQVTVASQATGSSLRVAVSGLPRDEHCWLYAVADDGTEEMVGQWVATYAGKAQVTGSTSIPSSHLARLVLEGTGGKRLVAVPV